MMVRIQAPLGIRWKAQAPLGGIPAGMEQVVWLGELEEMSTGAGAHSPEMKTSRGAEEVAEAYAADVEEK